MASVERKSNLLNVTYAEEVAAVKPLDVKVAAISQQAAASSETSQEKMQALLKKTLLAQKATFEQFFLNILNVKLYDIGFLTVEQLIELALLGLAIKIAEKKSDAITDELLEAFTKKQWTTISKILKESTFYSEEIKLIDRLIGCKSLYSITVFDYDQEKTVMTRIKAAEAIAKMGQKWIGYLQHYLEQLLSPIEQLEKDLILKNASQRKQWKKSSKDSLVQKLIAMREASIEDIKALKGLIVSHIKLLKKYAHIELTSLFQLRHFLNQLPIFKLKQKKYAQTVIEICHLEKLSSFMEGHKGSSKRVEKFFADFFNAEDNESLEFFNNLRVFLEGLMKDLKENEKECERSFQKSITEVLENSIKLVENYHKKEKVKWKKIEGLPSEISEKLRLYLLQLCESAFKKANNRYEKVYNLSEKGFLFVSEGIDSRNYFDRIAYGLIHIRDNYVKQTKEISQFKPSQLLQELSVYLLAAELSAEEARKKDGYEKLLVQYRFENFTNRHISFRLSSPQEVNEMSAAQLQVSDKCNFDLLELTLDGVEKVELYCKSFSAIHRLLDFSMEGITFENTPVDEAWLDEVDQSYSVEVEEEPLLEDEVKEAASEKGEVQVNKTLEDTLEVRVLRVFRKTLFQIHGLKESRVFQFENPLLNFKQQQITALHNVQWALELFSHIKKEDAKAHLLSWISFFGHQALEMGGSVEVLSLNETLEFNHSLRALFKFLKMPLNYTWIKEHDQVSRYKRYPAAVLTNNEYRALPNQLRVYPLSLQLMLGQKQAGNILTNTLPQDIIQLLSLQVDLLAKRAMQNSLKELLSHPEKQEREQVEVSTSLEKESCQGLSDKILIIETIEKSLAERIAKTENVRMKKALDMVLSHLQGLKMTAQLFREYPDLRFLSFYTQTAMIHLRYLCENMGVYLSIVKMQDFEFHTHDLSFYFNELGLGMGREDFLSLFKALGKRKEGEYLYHQPTLSMNSFLMRNLTRLYRYAVSITDNQGFLLPGEKKLNSITEQRKLSKQLVQFLDAAIYLIQNHVLKL